MILIPIHHSNHWYLIAYDHKELISLDPYNYSNSYGLKKEHLLKENREFHEQILIDLKDNYFKPLFDMHKRNWIDIKINAKIPPNIPAQNNSFDCGVFLLAFTKCLVFENDFSFSNEDMICIREEIKRELVTGNIQCFFRSQEERRVMKRKVGEEVGHPVLAIPRKKILSSFKDDF